MDGPALAFGNLSLTVGSIFSKILNSGVKISWAPGLNHRVGVYWNLWKAGA